MKKIVFIVACFIVVFTSCKNDEVKEMTREEKRAMDSVSRVEQKKKSDSLKGSNPLLIMPPDSNYTGDYIDKYGNGIVKFKGFFRFGERHGQWMSFYPDGKLWSEMHYEKGMRHGLNIAYFENGQKRYEGYYKSDLQDSVWSYFDEKGVLAQKILYKDNLVVKKLPLK